MFIFDSMFFLASVNVQKCQEILFTLIPKTSALLSRLSSLAVLDSAKFVKKNSAVQAVTENIIHN